MGSSGARVGAWLVGIPAVVEVFRFAGSADVGRVGGYASRFEFWADRGTTVRLAALLAILLILGQLAVIAIGGFASRSRFVVAAVGAVQALSALPTLIWDPYVDEPPSIVRILPLPSPGGRYVSGLVVLTSVAGIILALRAAGDPEPKSSEETVL